MLAPNPGSMGGMAITLADVEAAQRRIRPFIQWTPCVESTLVPGLRLKLESQQTTGSFKVRGALNAVLAASDADLSGGVSCVSAGNHGLGVAFAAKQRGVSARVYVPPGAVARKVDAIGALGAEVVEIPVARMGEMLVSGSTADGRFFINPFANAAVAAGQGTAALELMHDVRSPGAVFIPIGGGGLCLGVATVVKARWRNCRVYGVVAEGAPAFLDCWRTGKAQLTTSSTIADGLCAPIADVGVVTALKRLLDDVIVVDDVALRAAMRGLALKDKVIAEPAGAAGVAAALARKESPSVAIVSGSNVKPELLAAVTTGT